MFVMISGFSSDFIHFGKKISGDTDRIYIEDRANALTAEEEEKVLDLLHEVYEKSGMPVTVYTDDFDWRRHYATIEVYSEELYYSIGYEEDAMILYIRPITTMITMTTIWFVRRCTVDCIR